MDNAAPNAAASATPTTAAPAASDLPGAPAAAPAAAPPAATPRPRVDPVLWKPDGFEKELDVAPFLATYERKVKIDGQEVPVSLDDAFRAASIEKASARRFTEADRVRKEAEARLARIEEADRNMADPVVAKRVLSKRMGRETWEKFVLGEAAAILEYDKMPPEERRRIDERTAYEQKLMEERGQLAQKEAEIRRWEESQRAQRETALRARVEREWPPILANHGVPRGMVGDAMREMIDELRTAKKRGIHMSELEAARIVGVRVARKIAADTPVATAVAKQPGREVPVEQPRPAPTNGRREQRVLRPDDIRARFGR